MSSSETVRRATIMEVARLAGVSHQTVSRYLRFAGTGMKEATRQRIRSAIAELDYHPNLAARAMRTRRTGRLAVLLPEGSAHSSVEVMEGLTRTAHERGYEIEAITIGGLRHDHGRRVLEIVESGLFEGTLCLTPLEHHARLAASDTPLVTFPIYDHGMRAIGIPAGGDPITEIVQQLAALGHRRFLHVAGGYDYESARRRRDAYLSAIQSLDLESHGVVDCDWQPEKSMQAILDLPSDSGVTAVIGANDMLAAGVVRGAMARGWSVPEDLSVTGFDVNALGAWLNPSLTSVQVEYQRLGRQAMSSLMAALGDADAEPEGEPIMHVVWRDSVGPAPGHGR